ncbi:MAG TPA: hypothetical protein VGX23_27285 [Actinocrinis sp.]|nr:hypothetical protein [Actinocrinis sp.]
MRKTPKKAKPPTPAAASGPPAPAAAAGRAPGRAAAKSAAAESSAAEGVAGRPVESAVRSTVEGTTPKRAPKGSIPAQASTLENHLARQNELAAPVQSLSEIRAELADLTVRIDRERQVRCLPGQDFALDSATGRLIRTDIERLRRIDPATVPQSQTMAYFGELRDVCRRLLAEVCFGDSPARRQSTARNASQVGRQMLPREHFACLDGPAGAAESVDAAGSAGASSTESDSA